MEYPKCLEYVTEVVYPDEDDFKRAIELSRKLYKIGKPLGAIDVLIASICINRNLKLITKDRGFNNIKEIEEDFDFKII